MKSILFALSILVCSVTYAQEKTNDKKTETETKTVKIKSNKGTVENTVKVKTTEEGEVKLKEDPDHHENMDMMSSEKSVRREVQFSTDYDPFYESDLASRSYMADDAQYEFKSNDDGFTMSTNDDADMSNKVGSAMLTSNKKLYLIDMGGNSGIGYFSKDGKFVVEYYDNESGTMVKKEFSGIDK
jgi:hypothetical protein